MNSFTRFLLALSLGLFALASLRADDGSFKAPDSIILKDGRIIRGLIIKNTRDAVLMQEKYGEHSYPKSEIVRIYDGEDLGIEMTDIHRRGELPPWRVLANDLRTHDSIKSLIEIPATLIDNGVFKNVPYKSFRVNNNIEVNIYGDPENPAGLEIGIYGRHVNNKKLRRTLRSYIAGYLTTREEVAALYSIDLRGGERQAGSLTFEITPPNAPDAYGAWWISLYNKKQLDEARLSDEEYALLTRPVHEVMDKRGYLIRGNKWTEAQADLSRRLEAVGNSARVLLRGFYRDKNGNFRLVPDK